MRTQEVGISCNSLQQMDRAETMEGFTADQSFVLSRHLTLRMQDFNFWKPE